MPRSQTIRSPSWAWRGKVVRFHHRHGTRAISRAACTFYLYPTASVMPAKCTHLTVWSRKGKRAPQPVPQSGRRVAVRCAVGHGTHRVESAHAPGQRRPMKRGEAVVPTRGRDVQALGGGQRLDFLWAVKSKRGRGGGGRRGSVRWWSPPVSRKTEPKIWKLSLFQYHSLVSYEFLASRTAFAVTRPAKDPTHASAAYASGVRDQCIPVTRLPKHPNSRTNRGCPPVEGIFFYISSRPRGVAQISICGPNTQQSGKSAMNKKNEQPSAQQEGGVAVGSRWFSGSGLLVICVMIK